MPGCVWDGLVDGEKDCGDSGLNVNNKKEEEDRMWIHGVIFAGIAVFAAAGKRWPKNSRKKIVFIMLAANFMGLF